MKLDLGFFYVYIGKDGFHIEIEKHPFAWFVIHLTNKKGFDDLEARLEA